MLKGLSSDLLEEKLRGKKLSFELFENFGAKTTIFKKLFMSCNCHKIVSAKVLLTIN